MNTRTMFITQLNTLCKGAVKKYPNEKRRVSKMRLSAFYAGFKPPGIESEAGKRGFVGNQNHVGMQLEN